MSEITATVTTITRMVRERMEAVPLNAIVGKPTLNSILHLVKQLTSFTILFETTEWEGKHALLPLVLTETKMRLADGNHNLD